MASRAPFAGEQLAAPAGVAATGSGGSASDCRYATMVCACAGGIVLGGIPVSGMPLIMMPTRSSSVEARLNLLWPRSTPTILALSRPWQLAQVARYNHAGPRRQGCRHHRAALVMKPR